MKKTYTVTGMTCNGCKVSVEEALNKLAEVSSATAYLETSRVSIEMKKHLSIEKLQKALSTKYTISETKEEAEKKSELQQLFPLFLIFGYIIVTSVLLNYKLWHTDSFMLDFMGLFYIVFSFFKLLDLKGFPQSFRMYDPLAKVMPIYSWLYPFIEVALGIMFLMRIEIQWALIITLVILGITTIGVTKTLLNKNAIQCACLGTALKLPMTKATFIENSIMIVMALIMLIKN
ncbi:heavy-metal-associated domain-containing protein [Seonamhaeicola aphaedonensis]|uniref:Heavy-metal-associated domain-containing protein n=1 Tax=Seonamhaeicola aphaedonensis TaxID=1461338 RepID=A0A3D9HN96_9FLAO|nr:heavy metal-associated domain-containing protein [Seonamhaeicola aphaedonensis]RED50366.1 heavy-metal-associated domain-containing protein [Seonamhaeicola aphaedonensis]